MPYVKHQLEIRSSPSAVFEKLMNVGAVKEWAPVVTDSSCSDKTVGVGTQFTIDEDLEPVGGPKFHFANTVQDSLKDQGVL